MPQHTSFPPELSASPQFHFHFESRPLHCVTHEGKPWFVAAHACGALGIQNARDAVSILDSDEKADVGLTYTSRNGTVQRRRTTIISESGLYTLILRSRGATKPGTKAHRFRRWITTEVLPALRETGRYEARPSHDDQQAAWLVAQIGRVMPWARLLDLLYPVHEFGSIASNGRPRKGFRRAAFVAAGDRPAAARDFHERVIVLRYLLDQLPSEGRAA